MFKFNFDVELDDDSTNDLSDLIMNSSERPDSQAAGPLAGSSPKSSTELSLDSLVNKSALSPQLVLGADSNCAS